MNRQLVGRSYVQTATRTASPGQLILMLYEGAIRYLEAALSGFSADDPAEFNETINNNVQKAQAILDELNASLNLSAGGDVAASLRSLYLYLDRRLFESNLRKDPKGIEETVRRLTTVRDAWREMLSSTNPAGDEPVRAGLMALG